MIFKQVTMFIAATYNTLDKTGSVRPGKNLSRPVQLSSLKRISVEIYISTPAGVYNYTVWKRECPAVAPLSVTVHCSALTATHRVHAIRKELSIYSFCAIFLCVPFFFLLHSDQCLLLSIIQPCNLGSKKEEINFSLLILILLLRDL